MTTHFNGPFLHIHGIMQGRSVWLFERWGRTLAVRVGKAREHRHERKYQRQGFFNGSSIWVVQAVTQNVNMKHEQKNNCSEGGIRTLKTLFLRQVCMPVPSLRHVTTRTDSNRDTTLVRSQKHFHLCYGWLLGERWGSNPQIPDSQSGDFTSLSTITILHPVIESNYFLQIQSLMYLPLYERGISHEAGREPHFTTHVATSSRKGCQIRTGVLLLPRQARMAGLLQSLINKKASQLREAYSYLKSINTIVPYQNLIDVAVRVGVLISCHKYNSFALNRARGYNYFFASLNENMKPKSIQPLALPIYGNYVPFFAVRLVQRNVFGLRPSFVFAGAKYGI